MILLQLSAQSYYLVEKPDDASCTSFSLEDPNGNEVTVLDEIKSALVCPCVLDLNGSVLITYQNNKLVWYDIPSKQITILMELYSDIDGISSLAWSTDLKQFMFVVINQAKKHGYKEFCRIIVIRVDSSGKVTSKHKFDKQVNFSCGSICTSSPGLDFKFIDSKTISYRRHELIDDRPGEWETIRLK